MNMSLGGLSSCAFRFPSMTVYIYTSVFDGIVECLIEGWITSSVAKRIQIDHSAIARRVQLYYSTCQTWEADRLLCRGYLAIGVKCEGSNL